MTLSDERASSVLSEITSGVADRMGLIDRILRSRQSAITPSSPSPSPSHSSSRSLDPLSESHLERSLHEDYISETFDRHPIGKQVGRFRIEQLIGWGGFGRVYLANDTLLDREVAIKAVPYRPQTGSGSTSQPQTDVQLSEARAAAKLHHPNLVPLFEVFQDDHYQYLISEYCPGPTLAKLLQDNPRGLSDNWSTQIVLSIVEGVAYAHHQGFAHRDIKPGNILLLPHDATRLSDPMRSLPFTPKLTDFGLVQNVRMNNDPGNPSIAGTRRYMPPEQLMLLDDIDPQIGDIYAIGMVLYYALTGAPPQRPDAMVGRTDDASIGDSEATKILPTDRREVSGLSTSKDAPPPERWRLTPPRRTTSAIDPDLVAVCMTSLQPDPRNRYQSIDALLADLRRTLEGQPVLVRKRSYLEAASRLARRSPVTAGLTAALVSIAVAAAIFLVITNRRLTKQKRLLNRAVDVSNQTGRQLQAAVATAKESADQAIRQRQIANANRRRAERSAFRSDLRFAMTALQRNDFATADHSIRSIQRYARADQIDSIDFRLAKTLATLDCRCTGELPDVPNQILLVPGTDQFCVANQNGTIDFYSRSTGHHQRRVVTESNGSLHSASISGDGQTMAIGLKMEIDGKDSHRAYVIDCQTGEKSLVVKYISTTVESVALSFDGQHLAIGPRYRSISIIDRRHPERRQYITAEERNADLYFDNQGHLILLRDPYTIDRIDRADERITHCIACQSHLPWRRVGCSDDGRTIVSNRDDRSVHISLLSESDKVVPVESLKFDTGGQRIDLVAISPGGRFAAATTSSGKALVWRLTDDFLDSTKADADRIASADRTLQVRQLHIGGLQSIVIDDQGCCYSVSTDQTYCIWPSQMSSRRRGHPVAMTTLSVLATRSFDDHTWWVAEADGSVHSGSAEDDFAAWQRMLPPSGHSVTKFRWSPDRTKLAVADLGGRIGVTHVDPTRPSEFLTATLQSDKFDAAIVDMAFDVSGRKLAINQGRQRISILDIPPVEDWGRRESLKMTASIDTHCSVQGLLWSDLREVMTFDDTIRRWNIDHATEIQLSDRWRHVRCVTRDTHRHRNIVAGNDSKIRAYDDQGRLLQTGGVWLGDSLGNDGIRDITTIALSSDGRTIFAGSIDGMVSVWDAEDLSFLGELPIGDPVRSVVDIRCDPRTIDFNGPQHPPADRLEVIYSPTLILPRRYRSTRMQSPASTLVHPGVCYLSIDI